MRCTDCEFSKETIPAQVSYVYCTKQMIEVPTWEEFESCQYRDNDTLIKLGYKYLGSGTWIKED